MPHKLAPLLPRIAQLTRQHVMLDRLAALTLPPVSDSASALAALCHAWSELDLAGHPEILPSPGEEAVPFVAWLPKEGWRLVLGTVGKAWFQEDSDGTRHEAALPAGAVCLALPLVVAPEKSARRAITVVREALLMRRGVFLDAVLATALVNILTLFSSIYSMQVYDRVIPHTGLQTLWVLSVGVVLGIVLELLLKHVRSKSIDLTCTAIDQELSAWFFRRALAIRMERRPAAIGTLASQIKGFEMVRGVLTSTSLFILTDVPFALFFILVIALIGGWVALVPIVALPFALLTGLAFRRSIERKTRENMAGSNQKAGLLVEAIDGIESIKASAAEWRIQGRWNRLVKEVAESEHEVRHTSAVSANLTVALQQLSYVLIVAVGAWLVTENQLTMGALLACTIVSNRAMTPIVQLPATLVQWAYARAALEGLDHIMALPSEADECASALSPERLEPAFALERAVYSYRSPDQPALEIAALRIAPGERVGLIGPIGSGKSTLLKLLSGLFRPLSGKVLLGGMDMALLAPGVLRQTIAYLPQEMRLISGTLRDNLILGLPDPGDDALLAAAQKTGLIDLVTGQPKGLELEISEGGRGVSGGQRQLIALTRLLLANPAAWVLDEPTGAMDSLTEGRIAQLLSKQLGASQTLILATHKTALLPLLTRLVVLQNGRVVLDGPRDEVLKKLSGSA